MTKSTILSFLAIVFIVSFSACTDEEAARKAAAEKQAEELEESLSKVGEDLGEMGNELEKGLGKLGESLKGLAAKNEDGEAVEPVSHRELKKFMPESFNGVERSDYEGQTSGAFGFKVSTSEATYKDGNKRMEMTIIDTGGFGMALMGMASWSSIEVDKESSDGYERTTMFNGHKAFEKYNSRRESGELAMIIDDRFVVTCKFRNMEMDDVKKRVSKMDFDDLSDL